MSILYSTCSTPRSMSQLSVSAFDEKSSELEKLKKQAVIHLKRVNSIKLEYMEWWSNKHHTFLSALHTVQILNRNLCPQTINTMSDYTKVLEMANIYTRAGKLRLQNDGYETLKSIKVFWERLLEMQDSLEKLVLQPIAAYCSSITKLRDPRLKEKMDAMAVEITTKLDLNYDFSSVCNTKENLFAFRLSTDSQNLLGFVGFIPHVINVQRKTCYLLTKLAVEKV